MFFVGVGGDENKRVFGGFCVKSVDHVGFSFLIVWGCWRFVGVFGWFRWFVGVFNGVVGYFCAVLFCISCITL